MSTAALEQTYVDQRRENDFGAAKGDADAAATARIGLWALLSGARHGRAVLGACTP